MKSFIENLRSRQLVWDSILTTFWGSIGKGAGFVIPFLLARWFGISQQTDAFFFVYSIIIFLSIIFAPVIESVIVPFVVELKEEKVELQKFVGSVIVLAFFSSTILILLVLSAAKPVLHYATRFDNQQILFIQSLLNALSPLVVLIVLTSIISGVLNAFKCFTLPAVSPFFRAVVNLAIIFFLKDSLGIHSVVIGYVAGELIRFIILLIKAVRLKLITFVFSFNLRSEKVLHFGKTSLYQSIGMSILGLNPIIDKTMASWLQVGGVSVLEYANRLYVIPETFLSAGIMVTLLSHWSGRFNKFGIIRLNADVQKALKWVGAFSLFVTVLLILLSSDITKLIFSNKSINIESLNSINIVWIIFMIGFVPNMLGRVYMRAHLTLKNTKVILFRGIVSIILHIVLNLLLMKRYGVNGIAFSSTIVAIFYYFYIKQSFKNEIKNR